MKTRFSLVDRLVARVLVWTFVFGSVWTSAPPVSARAHHDSGTAIRQRAFPAYGGQASPTPSQTTPIYGPQTFTRTRGRANVFTATINVPAGVGGPFTLHVENGEPDHDASVRHDGDDDDDDDEDTDRRDHHAALHHFRVTKAEIAINGQVVVSKPDFREHDYSFDKSVTLTTHSTLTVTLRGKPNCFIVVSILGRTVDRTPPQLSIVAPSANTVMASHTPALVVSYSDPAGTGGASGVDVNTLVVFVDGIDRTSLFARGATQATAQLTTAEALADGAHAITATIADRAGNGASASSAFTVDSTAPTIQTIDPPAGTFVKTTTPTIRLHFQDADGVNLSTLKVVVGGQDRTSLFTTSATDAVATLDAASALPQGAVEIVTTIRDTVGNTGTSSSTFVVDSVPPAVEIVQPGADHYTFATAIDVNGTVTDASPSTVTVNGVNATLAGSAFTATGVPLGAGPDVTLQVTVTDAAGNTGQASRTVHVDRVSPAIGIVQPIAGAFVSGATLGVAGTVSDASPLVGVTVNGVPAVVSGGSFTANVPAPNGPLVLQAVAEDAAGNQGTAGTTVTVDSVAPILTMTSPADGFLTNQATMHVTGTVADATPVTAAIDGAPVPVVNGAFGGDTTLSPGQNAIAVTVIDAAGNRSSATVHGTVDQTAPLLQIAAPVSGAYVASATPAVRITYEDNGSIDAASLRVLVDGEDRTSSFVSAAGAATATLAALPDGAHQLSATIRDAAGNQSTAAIGFFTDTAGPIVHITSPAANAYLKGPSVVVNGSVTDLAIASVTVNGQAAPVSNGTFSATLAAADGPFIVDVAAIDIAGNQSTTSATATVDSVAPVLTVAAPAAGLVTNAASVRVIGTVSDRSPVTLTVGGVAVPVASGAFTYDAPLGSAGAVILSLAATDAAGNVATTSVPLTVDRVAPAVAITGPLPGAVLRGPAVTVTGTLGDASSATVSVNGVAAVFDPSSPPLSRTFSATVPVADGVVTLVASATDAASNTSAASVSITVDSIAPLVAILQPADGQYTNATEIPVSGTVIDATAVAVTVNGIAAVVNASAFAATIPVGSGPISTIAIVATDAAGNTSERSLSLQVDRVSPAIAITAPAASAYLKGPSISVSGTVDDVAIATVTVNGQPAPLSGTATGSSRTFTAHVTSGDGPLAIVVVATDVAGNQSTSSRSVTVDSVAPVVTVSAPAAGLVTNQAAVRVDGSVNDASPVTLTIGGVAVPVASNAFEYEMAIASDGAITIPVIATDAAGNVASTSVSLTVDRGAPSVQIASPASGAFLRGPSVTVSGSISDASTTSVLVNGVAASLDGSSSGSSGFSRTFTATVPVADGSVTLNATATDAAGNSGSASRTITVDSVAPALTLTAPAAGLVTSQVSVSVRGTVQDSTPVTLTIDGAAVPVNENAFAYDAPLAGEGARQIAVVATDAAGNRSTEVVSVAVDRTAPVIDITAPAGGVFLKGPTITVSGSVSDSAGASVVVNGVAATVSGNTFTASVPASDGALTLQAVATDGAGNSAIATTTVTIDSAAPVVTIVNPADGQYTAATSLDVSGGVNDSSAVRVTVNGVEAAMTGTAFVATGLPIGDGPSVPIQVVATDAAGNASTSTVTVRVDRTPPVVRITSPVVNAYRKGPVLHVEGTVTDLSPVLVEVNGELAAVNGGGFTADVPAGDGPFTVTATARDAAANTSTAKVAVIVDSVAPQIAVSAPAQRLITNQSTIQIIGTVSDLAPVTLRLGDVLVPLTDNTFSQPASLAPEGDRTLTLRATDAAGNESTFDVHVTLDQTPPDLSVTTPDAGATLGSAPISAQGFVYDAAATTVSVNGMPATRVQDAWKALVGGVSDGPQRLTIVATDAAGNTQTVTRDVTLDLSAPLVAFASPASGTLTNAMTIDVSGTASDVTLTSVVVNGTTAMLGPVTGSSRPFAATISLAEGENHLVATATDAFARTAQTEVIVARDSTSPTVSITAADTISRLRGAAATISASDDIGLAEITATLNGQPVATFTSAPTTLPLTVPAAVAVGDTLTLTVVATDRAGNSSSASHALRVIADGVVTGQVLSDETGLPLAGATVTSVGTGADANPNAAPRTSTSDERGGYSMPAADATVLVALSHDGMTTVERQVPIQNGVGTAVVDGRLTTIAPATTIDAAGGTLTAPNVALSIAAGALAAAAALSLTPVSAQGLPALLPLGWSPLVAFDIRGDAATSVAMSAAVSGLADPGAAGTPALVSYKTSTHGWFVVTPQIAVSDARASFAIPGTGVYALIVADVMDRAIVTPSIDQPLTGVEMVTLPPDAIADGTVSPATLPPGGGTAAGALAIRSSSPLPSGTIVQAQVTESYGLTSGAVASEEQRTQDIVLYRVPASQPPAPSPQPPSLSAAFPITPSRSYDLASLVEGRVHLDILAGREAVRGKTGGSEPITIDAGGGVTLTVPAHALPGDTAVRVQSAILSSFVPGATPNTAPPDVQPLGEVVVDFASQTLSLGAELTVGLPASVQLDPADSLLVARVVRVGGVPRMFAVARAEVAVDRLVSRAVPGLPGITESGRYVFYRIGDVTGFVAGTLSASGSPVNGLVESNTLPFVGLAGGDGRFVIATRAADVTLTGRVTGTSLEGTATVTVAAGQIAARDIVLAGAVTTATVTPGDGAMLVDVTTQIEIETTVPLDANAVNLASLTLTTADAPPQSIAIRRVLSGSGQVLALVPETKLAAATTYRFAATGLVDVHGGAVSIASVSFTTKVDAPSTYDTRKVIVSTPDDNGIAHVTAAPGTVPPGTQVLVVNAGSGSVASFTADNDGALNGEVSATIEDRLIVTITDPAGAVTTFERGTYVAPDQSKTAVNSAGGIVDEPGQAGFASGAKLVIPPDAVLASLFFSLTQVELRAVFPDEPDPDVPAGHVGGTIKITAPEGPLQKEAKISFDKPADAPDGAAYLVFRRLQGPNGKIAYEILDQALLDATTGKVTTASPPYAGFGLSLGGYTANGIGGAVGSGAIGSLVDQYETVMWFFDQALPKPLPGLITGTVRRAKFVPGAAAPIYEPVPNAMVSGVAISGRPLYDERSGATVAISQRDGTFALFDPRYTGGQVLISAKSTDGEVVSALAYEANPQEGRAGDLLRYYHNVAVANVTFAAKAPEVGPTRVTVHAFTGGDASRVEISGPITAGTPVRIRVSAETTGGDPTSPKPNVTSVSIQQTPYTVTPDSQTGDWFLSEAYVPPQAGTYVITATAQPPIGSPVTGTFILRAVAPGGTTRDSLPNDPPAVITSLTFPKANANGVQPSVVPQVSFTEPVKNIADTGSAHVTLTDSTGADVALNIQGAGLTGAVEHISDPNVIVTGLTLQPLVPLKYGTTYTLTLTTDIVDTDTPPKHLAAYQTTFTTFQPSRLVPTDSQGSASDEFNGGGIAVVGNRAYLAQNNGPNTTLRLFDVTKPEQPVEIGSQLPGNQFLSPPPIVQRGHPADLAVEDESPAVGRGRLLALGLTNLALPYHPSNLMFYDVTSDESWRWVGAVTLGTDPVDGMVRRIQLRGNRLYAATPGLGKGIQVVDVPQAMSLFAAAGATSGSPDYFELGRSLGLEGQGFGQQAIAQTIFVPSPNMGNMSNVWDLDVLDLTVDGTSQPIVVAAGRAGFTVANPQSQSDQLLFNGPVVDASGAPVMDWGFNVAAGIVNGLPIAAVLAFTPPSQGGFGLGYVVVIVDMTDARAPKLLGTVAIPSFPAGVRSDLLLQDDKLLVGTDSQTYIVGLANPSQPQLLGQIAGVAGRLAAGADGLVFTNLVGFADTVSQAGGVRSATLGTTARMTRITPSDLVNSPAGVATTTQNVVVQFQVVPSDYRITAANVELFKNGQPIETLAATTNGPSGQAVWPAGRIVDRDAVYTARVSVDPASDRPLVSAHAPVPLVQIVFVDKRGGENLVPPMSDPRPHVVLDPISAGDVTLTSDGATAQMRVSGTVTDSLADIVPAHAADITTVTFGEQTLPVQGVSEPATALRPYAFRGRFNGTVRVPVQNGPNRLAVYAENTVGNRSADSVTVTVQQTIEVPDVPPAQVFSADKYLDPLTLLWHPLREDAVDTLVVYRHPGTPSDEDFVVETAANTSVFTTTSPDLGDVTLTVTAPPAGNNPQTIDAIVSSSALALFDEPFTFVETVAGAGTFKTVARRLPDNSRLRVAFTAPPSSPGANTAAVTLERISGAVTATLATVAPGSLTFSATSGALGPAAVRIQSIEGDAGQPRTLNSFFTSGTAGVSDYYVAMNETGVGTMQFETETRPVALAPVSVVPTPASATVVGVANEPESPEVPAEPVWVVARGLRDAAVGDRGTLDDTTFELTTAAAPSAGGAPAARAVRFAQQVAFVKTTGSSIAPNIKRAVAPQQDVDRTTVQTITHNAAFTVNRLRMTRLFTTYGVTKAVLPRRRTTTLQLYFNYNRPDLHVTDIASTGDGVAFSKKQFLESQVPRENGQIDTYMTVNVTATVATDAPLGTRDLKVTFSDGQLRTFTGAFTVSQGRAVVFAIDGLSRSAFDYQVSQGGTQLNRLFGGKTKAMGQAIDKTILTTFPPITFTRWATIFSGHPPSDTQVPALQWLNRQALIDRRVDHGAPNQGLGVGFDRLAYDVMTRADAYNRHFPVKLIYEVTRDQGFRNVVILQQAGLGHDTTTTLTPDEWVRLPGAVSTAEAMWNTRKSDGEAANLLDELATKGAVNQLTNWGTLDFDLMVVYLAGLDHQLHGKGVFDDAGRNVSDDFFASGLDARLKRIVDALGPRIDSTIFGLYADHGHFNTFADRSIELDVTGAALDQVRDDGLKLPPMRAVLQARKTIKVGAKYEELGGLRRPNVIFSPQFGIANIYVAGNTSVAGAEPDWIHPASLDDLQPIVNSLWDTYMPKNKDNWGARPIADILVRVPGPDGGFTGSRYKVVPRDYHHGTARDCGTDQNQACTLGAQLAEASTLEGLGIGADFDEATNDWRYAAPAERLADAISANSGDIILLANGRWNYQFGEPDRAQHGSLTFKDAQVPMAFGFPTATGDPKKDDMLAPILDFLKGQPDRVAACSGDPQSRTCIEEQTLERFFIKPPS